MQKTSSADSSAPVFRVDKFIVPTEALPAFLALMQKIQRLVLTLPGCERDLVLTQTGGAGQFNVVHLIEWADDQAVANALNLMPLKFAEEGLDPPALIKSLGVQVDFGLYSPV